MPRCQTKVNYHVYDKTRLGFAADGKEKEKKDKNVWNGYDR